MIRDEELEAAQVEALRRDLAGVISSDQILNDEFGLDVSERKKPQVEIRRSAPRRFVRFLVAICIGVAGTLAWQSYGAATKRIIATNAPELGWSPEAKQMIASSIQWLGWTNPANREDRESVAPKTPASSSDPAQVQQIAQNLAGLREMVQQLTAGQDQTAREIAKLESVVVEILMKIPEPQPPAPAAPARKPAPAPPPSSRPAIPPKQ